MACVRAGLAFTRPCVPCHLQDVSVVIVEFALNDGTQAACKGDGSGTVPARASFERLLRKLQVGGGCLLGCLTAACSTDPVSSVLFHVQIVTRPLIPPPFPLARRCPTAPP